MTAYLVEEKVYRRHGPNGGSPNIAAIRAGRENLRYHLAYISHLAETRPWLSARAPSFADLAAAAHLSTLDYLGEVSWDDYEPVKNWYALLKSRPSFRPLLADRVAGFIPVGDVCRSRFLTHVGDCHGAFAERTDRARRPTHWASTRCASPAPIRRRAQAPRSTPSSPMAVTATWRGSATRRSAASRRAPSGPMSKASSCLE